LAADLQSLRQELIASGGSGIVAAGGIAVLDRMDAIEAELMRLIARAEALENRINRVVADGTNRLGDLEFRLCELEPGCDISKVGVVPLLGGGVGQMAALPLSGGEPRDAQAALAMNEQEDFDRAFAALEQGEFLRAAELLAAFELTYTGGPLSGEVQYLRGEALFGAGDIPAAARAWLEAFSASPEGPRAPDSLYRLGLSLAELGQVPEACATLSEVSFRFPDARAATDARAAMQSFSCQQ
jgi:tol-pal system protein YbgF